MKRLRSYGEDLDDVVGKEWERREIDADRSSSRRRFYVKSESLRRSSSSLYDRSMDEDREAMRPPRKRYEHDVDGFDRRKIFDRYRDGGGGGGGGGVDRAMHVSSPRVPYGSERMHRSESFSTIRRDFPKGFRSERDRSRREVCGGLSWRRLSCGKEAADEEKRSPARDSEDRGKARSRDSSSGEQSKDGEAVKANLEKVQRESCSSSEMEEGELEPDPLPEPSIGTGALAERHSQHFKDKEDVIKNASEASSENKDVQLSIKTSDSVNETSCGERSMEMEVTQITRNVTLQEERIEIVEKFNEEIRAEGEGSIELRRQRESFAEWQGEAKDLPEDIYKEEKPEDTPCKEKKDLAEDICEEEKLKDSPCRETKEIISGERSHLPSQFSIPESKNQLVELVVKDDELANVHTSSLDGNLEEMAKEVHFREVEVYDQMKEVTSVDLEVVPRKDEGIDQVGFGAEQGKIKSSDLQAETVGEVGYCNSVKEINSENNLISKPMLENPRDKGKSIACSLSNMADSADDENAVEGPSRSRGFELVFHDHIIQPDKASSCGSFGGRIKNEKLKLEPLDLSLSLPGALPDQNSKPPNSNPSSPVRTGSIQSFPSSFRTVSDGFTNSFSFSSSQPFVHNPSCSLTQNSVENFEQSVGSRPVFPGVDKVSSGTIRQSQTSIEPKRKGGAGALFHRVLLNGNHSQNSIPGVNGHHNLNSNPLLRQPNFPRQPSPQSVGSRDTLSEHSKDKRMLTRERSFNSLSKSEQREGEQIVVNVLSVVERIITRIVSEPLQVMERMLHDMSEHSMEYLKDSICKMLSNTDKRGQIHALQGTLQKRSDLTAETMSKCPKTLLEILVALKTGLPDFLQRSNNVPSSDLVEIYHNLKCHNIACGSVLPADDCDCKICSKKNGFCSACMCLICSKFDMASNTCSWVGCDVCLHWCHTDCGLRGSYIKNGRSSSVAPGATEMQFHCVACGHPSEMYGFVKEVFKMCSKDWKVENLAKELQYVRRIFCTSNDTRGKSLYQVAGQMLVKLEDKKKHSEVIKNIMSFLSESESSSNGAPPLYPPTEPPVNNDQRGNAIAFPIEETPWLSPISSTKVSRLLHNTASDDNQLSRQRKDSSILQTNFEKKPMVDELESVVGFKQAEAKLYQERADNARREADGLKRIAAAKNGKIEDEYKTKMAKLQLYEAEENRRQKIEELQALERAHQDFVSLKTRMEAEIKDLLLRMEATSRNFNA